MSPLSFPIFATVLSQRLAASHFGLSLPLAKLRYFMAIAAGRDAAPLTSVIFGRVVEIEHTGSGIGASTEIAQVRLNEEKGDLASENRQCELFPLELRNRANKRKSFSAVPVQRLVKNLPDQKSV